VHAVGGGRMAHTQLWVGGDGAIVQQQFVSQPPHKISFSAFKICNDEWQYPTELLERPTLRN
jgi:hypothetical protein